MSKEEIPECIRCGKPQEYNPYQYFWYCPDPNCPPGRSRMPFSLIEDLSKINKTFTDAEKLKFWCCKCDIVLKEDGIALDCPEDGVFYKCPSCNYRIVIFPKEV